MATKQQQIDISKLSLEQLNSMKQEHEESVQELSSQLETMKLAEGRFRESRNTLDIIKLDDQAEGKEMLVPLTQSLYVSGNVLDADQVLVDIGTGYFLQKSVQGAQEMIDRKLKVVTQNMDSIHTVVNQKQENLNAIVTVMQYKMQQIQKQKAEQQPVT
uniref:Prefoldin subunit 5 n=1 Tax=Aureoumbra lagunensis TaxID=44058 RepID=A0A7S3NIR8_9STRA|mmetsp:Transcript_686/g.872  ORF Transcript_686/g.872 Transcript_686/m.872 type:complete len:159 (-) Transcript_686:358-834(-)